MKRAVYLILLILALVAPAIYLVGCTVDQADGARDKINAFKDLPVIGELPFVREGAAIALAGLALWREVLRRRQLRTVARSVNVAVQSATEPVKEAIKAAQGPQLSALMKSYRGT